MWRNASPIADAVAPNNPWLGVMLPYTPLHHLLMRTLDGTTLVMTSGNRSNEPIVYDDHDALERLRGIRTEIRYERQAAMELEWLATDGPPDGSYPFDLQQEISAEANVAPLVVDTRPMIRAVADDVLSGIDASRVARRFHCSVVDFVGTVCERLRDTTGINAVALSGGVFMNALLTTEATTRLEEQGFCVYRHRQVPPGDGGLGLGQLAVAAAQGR